MTFSPKQQRPSINPTRYIEAFTQVCFTHIQKENLEENCSTGIFWNWQKKGNALFEQVWYLNLNVKKEYLKKFRALHFERRVLIRFR